ncbi:MAG: lipopolysaccharide heptosyltransferase II [Desulfobacteraceae bacterium]|nr:lipopolysaccharide heptosyltransferase II [Desulfobacteraceae bacterium]
MIKLMLKDNCESRILIRAANWVGDAIMTTPVIRGMRKNYPRARITVLAKPWVVPVYETNPHVDEVMIYENSGRHKMGKGTLRLAGDIRKRRFDMAILMQNAFEAALLAFLARIPERVGYNTDGRSLLLNRCVKLPPNLKKAHLIDYYIGILRGAGLEDDGKKLDLVLNAGDRESAKKLLSVNGLGETTPLVGINPGATGGTAKRWFPDRYADLCRQLFHQYRTKVLIFGGPADDALGNQIMDMAPGCCINIAGKTTLSQAFALIENCDLFVTNDSGLMHAAAALNVNQVAIIGSTDYIATAPVNANSIMVRESTSCAPCLKDECPVDHRCMTRIGVDAVMEVCRSVLG